MLRPANLAAVAIGGGAGSCARYIVAILANRVFPTFPAGTAIVNISGSLVLGFAATLAAQTDWLSLEARLLLMTGFLGGYTTFSTFMYETVHALQNQEYRLAFLSLGGQLLLGLAGAFAGILGALWWLRR